MLPTYSHFTFPSLSTASGSGVSFQPSRSSEYRGVSGFRLLWAAGQIWCCSLPDSASYFRLHSELASTGIPEVPLIN